MSAYEWLAWTTRLHDLGIEVEYKSAKERRMREGLMALVRIREKRAGTWLRSSYGDAAEGCVRESAGTLRLVPARSGLRRRGAGRPAARRAAGPRSGSDPGGSDPDEPSPSRRLTGREDIEHWLDERRRTLTALTATDQLSLEELAA
jgi:hypothetical protein